MAQGQNPLLPFVNLGRERGMNKDPGGGIPKTAAWGDRHS